MYLLVLYYAPGMVRVTSEKAVNKVQHISSTPLISIAHYPYEDLSCTGLYPLNHPAE